MDKECQLLNFPFRLHFAIPCLCSISFWR